MKAKILAFLLLCAPLLAQVQNIPDETMPVARTQINANFAWLAANKISYQGTWSSGATYDVQDLVIYSSAAYISLQAENSGNNPATAALWWVALPGGGSLGGSSAGPVVVTTGSGVPSANCPAPSSTNLEEYIDTTNGALWWCPAANTWKEILSVTPSHVFYLAGDTGTAPNPPPPGEVACYFDSTSNTEICETSSGEFSTTVVGQSSAPSSGYCLQYIDTAGVQHFVPCSAGSSGTVGTPAATPGAGTYSSSQTIALAATNSTSIYYSWSATPTCTGTGTLYTSAIPIATGTLQAIGCASGWTASPVLSAAYTSTGAGLSLISADVAYGQSVFSSPVYPYGGTVAVNNAGAKIVVVVFSANAKTGSTFTVTSSLGNTCSLPLAVQTATTGANNGETVGIATCTATHSGTDSIVAQDTAHLVTSGVAIAALPYSDSGSAAADQSDSNLLAGADVSYGTNPVLAGSIIPTVNGEAVVTGFDAASSDTTIDSGMTIVVSLASNYGGTGANVQMSVAALFQTTAAAINPSWGTDQIYHAPVAVIVSIQP